MIWNVLMNLSADKNYIVRVSFGEQPDILSPVPYDSICILPASHILPRLVHPVGTVMVCQLEMY